MEVPNKVFKCRAQDDNGDYQWVDKTTSDYFSGKKIMVFSLPGAFTPI
jgi:peroxiredoxin|tara:strand:- start:462 stop:605 length:144 start_codon:yes stop_codon:yes gene_type:complete